MTIDEMQHSALKLRELFAQLEAKNGTSWDTRAIMEGFTVDVGELMELVMAHEGLRKVDNLDEKIAHELSDCLWSILVLAHYLGVDLNTAYPDTLTKLTTKLNAKLSI